MRPDDLCHEVPSQASQIAQDQSLVRGLSYPCDIHGLKCASLQAVSASCAWDMTR